MLCACVWKEALDQISHQFHWDCRWKFKAATSTARAGEPRAGRAEQMTAGERRRQMELQQTPLDRRPVPAVRLQEPKKNQKQLLPSQGCSPSARGACSCCARIGTLSGRFEDELRQQLDDEGIGQCFWLLRGLPSPYPRPQLDF